VTNLPDAATLRTVFQRMHELLAAYAAGAQELPPRVVDATARFK